MFKQTRMFSGDLCDVKGIFVGHAQDFEAKTGVTAVLVPHGAVGGVDVRGAAPGTRETDLLAPQNTMQLVHGIALCGGSAFGLDAAGGVMQVLESQGIGFDVGVAKVPIVPAAVIFDLACGNAQVRPDKPMGAAAAKAASAHFAQGLVGAGTGATCGKVIPGAQPHRGGVGSASVQLPGGAVVAALVVVNACGDIYDPRSGRLVAAGTVDGKPISCLDVMFAGAPPAEQNGTNTTIGVIATDAVLDKAGVNRLATVAHDGLALAIRPTHTVMDGDTLFTLSTGTGPETQPALLHAAAVQAVWQAVLNAVTCEA